MKSFFDIDDYRLLATHYYDGEPSRFKAHNGSVELIVWLSSGRWRCFVRKIAYLVPVSKDDQEAMRHLESIGVKAVDMLNKMK